MNFKLISVKLYNFLIIVIYSDTKKQIGIIHLLDHSFSDKSLSK